MELNQEAFEHAKSLIKSAKVDRNSDWNEIRAQLGDKDALANNIDWETYSQWFLAVQSGDDEKQVQGRYDFLYGDFNVVHRSALIAAKGRAHQLNYHNIEQAIDTLLVQIDKEPDVVSEASDESFPASDPPNWRDRR